MAAAFLSQASSYFGRTNISASYTIDDSIPAVHAGLWRIQRATRNSSASASDTAAAAAAGGASGKAVVSIWTHTLEGRGGARAAVVEVLKKEASSLTRLRHPCVLEMQEPLEETRNELVFATEPVLAPLSEALIASESAGRAADGVQLDEVEIQKGLLQVSRGLEFLHSARMVHGNLTPDSILINAKGDWKLGGFAFLTPLTRADGTPTPWQLDYDPSLPHQLSRDFNYLAPEYALDEKLEPANDMYALGCVVYAIHSKGRPPFSNRNSIAGLRSNVEQLSTIANTPAWQRLSRDQLDLLAQLVTRYPGARLTAASFQNSEYFNNVLVRTLKFMERDNFAGRNKEERVQFLKGLLGIMEQFSQRLQRRKVLPALLELMNDRTLLPFILPNVFVISKNLSSIEFTSNVLPKLKPLFSIQDPPQNQLLLLDQVELFVTKTSPPVFREEVTPLLYSSLEAEQVMVQERALQTVPRLCEILEYSHVKEVLFPNIAKLFSKTKVLSCKINTLMCFHSMIGVLDKFTLTEKLVPILARIKTREPSVMIATLAVHEAMSKKVDRETLATAIIPQLWTMSMGAALTAEQFGRFMKAVREMGERVEKEHMAHLREQRHMQEHTESYTSSNGGANGVTGGGLGGGVTGVGASTGQIDFATLVGTGKGSVQRDAMPSANDPFGFDDLQQATSGYATPTALTPSHTGSTAASNAAAAFKPRPAFGSAASSSTLATSSTTRTSIAPPPSLAAARPTPPLAQSSSFTRPAPTPPPGWSGQNAAPLAPSTRSPLAPPSLSTPASSSSASASAGGPNYNVSLQPAYGFNAGDATTTTTTTSALATSSFSGGLPPLKPQTSSLGSFASSASTSLGAAGMGSSMSGIAPAHALKPAPAPASGGLAGPPGWGGATLLPTSKAGTGGAKGGGGGANAWDDFDPLK